MNPDQQRRMQEYLRQVREVVQASSQILTEKEQAAIEQLVAHDEPAEGLQSLAWIIADKEARVPASTIKAIRELTEGLVDPAHLPHDLDLYAAE